MYDWLLFLSLYRQKPNSDENCLFELVIYSLFNLNKNNNDDYTLYFREFVKNAWADIERFKEQKNHDLKEALISYAVMQISMCKKVGFGFIEGTSIFRSAGKFLL